MRGMFGEHRNRVVAIITLDTQKINEKTPVDNRATDAAGLIFSGSTCLESANGKAH